MSHRSKQLRNHTKKRANQRFGLSLTTQDTRLIRQLIRDGKSEFVSRTSLDRSLHRVTYQGEVMIVVYSKRHSEIVTVLYE